MLRAIATSVTSPGGLNGNLQFNDNGALGGATGLVYDPAGSILFTATSQATTQKPLRVSGISGQTADLLSADVNGTQRMVLTAAGRLAIGDWSPVGYSVESTAFAVRAPARYYVVAANDALGSMTFMRSDATVGLQFLPGATFTTFGPTGTTTTGLVINTSLGDMYFTPGASGAQKAIYFGRRTDNNAAVGASCEFWTATGQTAPAWVMKRPGGTPSLTQVGIRGELLAKTDDSATIIFTLQSAAGVTVDMAQNKDSAGNVLSGITKTGSYFHALTNGAPAVAGTRVGEEVWDPNTFISYRWDGAVWRTSPYV